MSWRIILPWPEEGLWQNRRLHWSKRHAATKRARHLAWALAKEAKVPRLPNARIRFFFCPPPMARPDIQNMPATVKASIDGIADAMGCDDRHFRPEFPSEFGQRIRGGAVMIEVLT